MGQENVVGRSADRAPSAPPPNAYTFSLVTAHDPEQKPVPEEDSIDDSTWSSATAGPAPGDGPESGNDRDPAATD